MAKQSANEYRQHQREALVREMDVHKGGIKYAEGQVQELKELIEQIDCACEYCGMTIRQYGDEEISRMDRHIQERHPEDWEELVQERQESARKVLEAQVEYI